MLEVYHHPICPFSRKLRIILKEKRINFELLIEKYWERRPAFVAMNPACNTPVVFEHPGKTLISNSAIFEFFEETHQPTFLGNDVTERAETRRICEWFDQKFYNEITHYLINEKFIKVVSGIGAPNSNAIRAAKKNLTHHLSYLEHLLKHRDYLAGDKLSLADISAAAQLSVLDFIGDVNWEHHYATKHWYALIKSRPSFKSILFDKVAGIYPPIHYTNPDF